MYVQNTFNSNGGHTVDAFGIDVETFVSATSSNFTWNDISLLSV